MSEKTEVKVVEIKEEVRTLATAIGAAITGVENGTITLADDVYEKSLESSEVGVDLKQVKKLQSHNNNFVAGLQLAVGEKGIELMKKDKELSTVSASVKLGGDRVAVQFDRSQDRPGEKENETVYGVSSASYIATAAGNKAALKSVRDHLAEVAKKSFS